MKLGWFQLKSLELSDTGPNPASILSYVQVHDNMSKSVCISSEFHEFITSHKRDDKTMEETLRRLIGGPEDVAGIISSETAEEMRNQLDKSSVFQSCR